MSFVIVHMLDLLLLLVRCHDCLNVEQNQKDPHQSKVRLFLSLESPNTSWSTSMYGLFETITPCSRGNKLERSVDECSSVSKLIKQLYPELTIFYV